MKWIGTKNLGLLLLAIWLIASGVLVFVHLTSSGPRRLWPRLPSLPVCCSCWVADSLGGGWPSESLRHERNMR